MNLTINPESYFGKLDKRIKFAPRIFHEENKN